MALGRNLTKRLQRLRSRSNDLNREQSGNGSGDGFVSISFEQTTDSGTTTPTTSASNNNSHTQTPEQGQSEDLTTCSSGSSTNSGAREPITPSDLTLEAQRIYNENSNTPLEYFGNPSSKSLHKHTPSNSSSIYSSKHPPPEKPVVDMDARADEMAMDILEKVSADDYLREIRTGSWYIQ